MTEDQQNALKNAAEQFVTCHAEGTLDAAMIDYFEDIFWDALSADPDWVPVVERSSK